MFCFFVLFLLSPVQSLLLCFSLGTSPVTFFRLPEPGSSLFQHEHDARVLKPAFCLGCMPMVMHPGVCEWRSASLCALAVDGFSVSPCSLHGSPVVAVLLKLCRASLDQKRNFRRRQRAADDRQQLLADWPAGRAGDGTAAPRG
uniref:Transmembrane protein n=1 Tax=Toxoplasma gondii TgCATBr9 TaxID=943120 RepID=A0A2T6IR67_TOXGO|nr:hypothetical protein TGBR9_270010C [Toxoplasma gondii TgCATBr9]